MIPASEHIWGLVCGLPEPKRSNRLLLILRAFIDDSHMGQYPLYVLAGWVAPAAQWAAFVDDWNAALLASPRIKRFKFDEAMGLTGEFLGMTAESRDEKMRRLVTVISDHKLLGIASLIPHDLFQMFFGSHKSPEVNNPYLPSFYGIISRLVRYYVDIGINEKIEFVFDYQPDRGKKSMQRAQDGWELFYNNAPPEFRSRLNAHPPSFLTDDDFVALQAADLHAGWVRALNVDGLSPPWKSAGSEIVRINWTLTPEAATQFYEEMFGFKPIPFTYSFRYGYDPAKS